MKVSSVSAPLEALQFYCRGHHNSVSFDSFTILHVLKSCSHLSCGISILHHFHAHLLKLGFCRNVYVTTCLLSAYALKCFDDACLLFSEMPVRNTVSWNVMITGYARHGDIAAARHVFDEMPQRNVASWSAIISAYLNHSCFHQGFSLFRQMLITKNAEDVCLKPDQFTLVSILASCSKMGLIGLVLGKSMHAFSIRNGWDLDMKLGACLVGMYAKCGHLKMANSIFNMMGCTNVVTWTALICGAAYHGFGREALMVFDKMIENGVIPNSLTFTGILNACVHVMLVDEGRKYFRMMQQQYGIMPGVEHYGCLVELLGKAGMLVEALEVIDTMPFRPNIVIWGSFLTWCKLHRQFEMAEKVIDEIMKVVRPENGGGLYSLIADIYTLGGKWSEAEQLRELMQTQNVRKARGYSFI